MSLARPGRSSPEPSASESKPMKRPNLGLAPHSRACHSGAKRFTTSFPPRTPQSSSALDNRVVFPIKGDGAFPRRRLLSCSPCRTCPSLPGSVHYASFSSPPIWITGAPSQPNASFSCGSTCSFSCSLGHARCCRLSAARISPAPALSDHRVLPLPFLRLKHVPVAPVCGGDWMRRNSVSANNMHKYHAYMFLKYKNTLTHTQKHRHKGDHARPQDPKTAPPIYPSLRPPPPPSAHPAYHLPLPQGSHKEHSRLSPPGNHYPT